MTARHIIRISEFFHTGDIFVIHHHLQKNDEEQKHNNQHTCDKANQHNRGQNAFHASVIKNDNHEKIFDSVNLQTLYQNLTSVRAFTGNFIRFIGTQITPHLRDFIL